MIANLTRFYIVSMRLFYNKYQAGPSVRRQVLGGAHRVEKVYTPIEKEKCMTREDIKKQFPEATEEQITALLNINGTDIEGAKKNNVDPKVLKQLQEDSEAYKKLQEANLTDAEKIQKALDDAEAAKVEFAKKSSRLEVEKILVGAGLTEEDYKDLIDGLVSEDADASKTRATKFSEVLKKQKEAVEKKTKESLMDGTQTPGGSGSAGEEKTQAEKIAEKLYGGKKEKSDILSHYA